MIFSPQHTWSRNPSTFRCIVLIFSFVPTHRARCDRHIEVDHSPARCGGNGLAIRSSIRLPRRSQLMFPQLPTAVRVFLCTRPTDMRKSFDGVVVMMREFLGQDPLSGHLCLFLNRRRDRARILFWEPDGLVISYKRFRGRHFSTTRSRSPRRSQFGASRPRAHCDRLGVAPHWHRRDDGAAQQTLHPRRLSLARKIFRKSPARTPS
jgi:transposase